MNRVPKLLERDIQKTGMELLRSLGWKVHRRNTGAYTATYKGKTRFVRFSEKGAADVWFTIPQQNNRHGEWEVKRGGERPTMDQVRWLRQMNEDGGAAFWTDSVAILERVAKHLNTGGRIEYLDTMWRFGKVESLGGDYDLV